VQQHRQTTSSWACTDLDGAGEGRPFITQPLYPVYITVAGRHRCAKEGVRSIIRPHYVIGCSDFLSPTQSLSVKNVETEALNLPLYCSAATISQRVLKQATGNIPESESRAQTHSHLYRLCHCCSFLFMQR